MTGQDWSILKVSRAHDEIRQVLPIIAVPHMLRVKVAVTALIGDENGILFNPASAAGARQIIAALLSVRQSLNSFRH